MIFFDWNHLFYFKVFDGNSDQFTVVSHKLQDPIITRYIRINPISYHLDIALRADFYGCKSGKYLAVYLFQVYSLYSQWEFTMINYDN